MLIDQQTRRRLDGEEIREIFYVQLQPETPQYEILDCIQQQDPLS